MKITTLIEHVNKNKNKLLNPDQMQSLLKKTLEIKEYLGIKQKKELVESIVNACIIFDDGVFKFDDIDKYICFTMKTIEAYTNLELSDDMEVDYDMLCEAKLLNTIVSIFKTEYDEVNILLQMKCDYILSGNTMEAQIGRFLDDVSGKLDALVDAVSKKVEKFDFKNMPIDKNGLQKLMKFLESYK